MNLAGVLSNTEKYSEAEELYKNALTLNPNDADAYNNYAVFLGKQGNLFTVLNVEVSMGSLRMKAWYLSMSAFPSTKKVPISIFEIC